MPPPHARTELPSTVVLRRLTLPRFLFRTARSTLHVARPPHSWGLATSLLQDTVEILLRLTAEHHGLPVNAKAPFESLLGQVEERFPGVAGHRTSLTTLNATRTAFKHRGQGVSFDDAQIFLANVELFLAYICEEAFGVDFARVSLADSIGHLRTQNWLTKADSAFDAGDYTQAVAHAAKAMAVYMSHSTRNDVAIALRPPPLRDNPFPALEKWADALSLVQTRLDLFTRGVDVADFDRFVMLTPRTTLTRHGHIVQAPQTDTPPPTRDEARFCIDFAVDAALALRDRRVSPPRSTRKPEKLRLTS